MKEVDVIILYEGKARELESVCLIACEMEKRGYSVEIVNTFSYQIFRKKKIIAKLVITPFLYHNSDIYDYIYKICGKAQKIINLRWEQIFSVKSEKDKQYFGYPKGEARKAIHICWSSYLQELLIESGIEENNAPVCGAIQMDFLQPQFAAYYRDRQMVSKERSLDPKKRWNLFISSFSYSTLTKKEIKTYNRKVSKDSADFAKFSIESKKMILKWIENRLKEEKNEIWIYRPHPAERDSLEISNMQKMYSNFYVAREYDIRQWIVISDLIVNWRSTSLADVEFAGKKSITIRPINIDVNSESSLLQNIRVIDNELQFSKELYSSEIQKNENIYKYYLPKKKVYIGICDICEKAIMSSINQNIDYETIVNNISFTQRLRESILYYGVMRIVIILIRLSKKGIKIPILRTKQKIIRNDLNNFASSDEIDLIKQKLRRII